MKILKLKAKPVNNPEVPKQVPTPTVRTQEQKRTPTPKGKLPTPPSLPTTPVSSDIQKKIQQLEKEIAAAKTKEKVAQQLASFAKRHKIHLREDSEANNRLVRQKIARFVEAHGGKLIETPKGLKAVNSKDHTKDLIIDRKVFDLDKFASKIFSATEPKPVPTGNKPEKQHTEKLEEKSSPKGYEAFKQTINNLITQAI